MKNKKGMQKNVFCMRHLVKVKKYVASGELFSWELCRAAFLQQLTLGDKYFHLHFTLCWILIIPYVF